MIPQKNISKISNKTFEAGGRRIPEAVIEYLGFCSGSRSLRSKIS